MPNIDEKRYERAEAKGEEKGRFYGRGRKRTNARTSNLVLSFPFLIKVWSQLRLGEGYWQPTYTQKLVMHNCWTTESGRHHTPSAFFIFVFIFYFYFFYF